MNKLQAASPEGSSMLQQYEAERNRQILTLRQVLTEDPRLSAAWFSGSIGRGQEDALSDVDLRVVVEDVWIDEVNAERRAFASRVGPVILFVEAPQNAPEGGAYLMACYDAPTAPHIIDWQWQPRSLAVIPPKSRVIFNRGQIPSTDQAPALVNKPAVKAVTRRPMHFISAFWMMLMIAAKHVCRAPRADGVELLPQVTAHFADAQRYLGETPVLQASDLPPARTPEAKMSLLRDLAGRMQPIMARVAEQGQEVPSVILPGAYRYLDLVETAIIDRKEFK